MDQFAANVYAIMMNVVQRVHIDGIKQRHLIAGLVQNNPSIDQVWIGASGVNQDEKFVWTDGKGMSYTNWQPGESLIVVRWCTNFLFSG